MNTRTMYIFDCPVHGEETGVLCFRAFSEENRDRWKKVEVLMKEIPLPDEELNSLLKNLKDTYGTRLTAISYHSLHGE